MILIDLMSVMIPSIMVMENKRDSGELSPSLLRHMLFRSLAAHKRHFYDKYGDLVICIDDRDYWRKEIFPYYKASRKKARENSGVDWQQIFDIINPLKEELKAVLPYKVLQIAGAEADDIIGVLCEKFGDYKAASPAMLIISSDKDLTQLLKYQNVEQYSPVAREFIRVCNPAGFLQEHILRGDSGDGIPNFLSPDDAFVSGTHQTPLFQVKMNEWSRFSSDEFCTTDAMRAGYARNRQLIDLTQIPAGLSASILEAFENTPIPDKRHLRTYFAQHDLAVAHDLLGEL